MIRTIIALLILIISLSCSNSQSEGANLIIEDLIVEDVTEEVEEQDVVEEEEDVPLLVPNECLECKWY